MIGPESSQGRWVDGEHHEAEEAASSESSQNLDDFGRGHCAAMRSHLQVFSMSVQVEQE